MSKVNAKLNDEYTMSSHTKAKIRRNLRRKETRKKINDRISNYKNNVYPFCIGYYVKDEKRVGIYHNVEVPEQTIPIKEYFYETAYDKELDMSYKWLTYRISGYKTIPAHIEKRCIKNEYIPIPERPIRIKSNAKTYAKKEANKKVRRDNKAYNRGLYKKVFDVQNEIW